MIVGDSVGTVGPIMQLKFPDRQVALSLVPGLAMTLQAPTYAKENEPIKVTATLSLFGFKVPDVVNLSFSNEPLRTYPSGSELLVPWNVGPADSWTEQRQSGEEFTVTSAAGEMELRVKDRFNLVEASLKIRRFPGSLFIMTITGVRGPTSLYAQADGMGSGGYPQAMGYLREGNRLAEVEVGKRLYLNPLFPLFPNWGAPWAAYIAPNIGGLFPVADTIGVLDSEADGWWDISVTGGIQPGIPYVLDGHGRRLTKEF